MKNSSKMKTILYQNHHQPVIIIDILKMLGILGLMTFISAMNVVALHIHLIIYSCMYTDTNLYIINYIGNTYLPNTYTHIYISAYVVTYIYTYMHTYVFVFI